jgi:hypothetical protein
MVLCGGLEGADLTLEHAQDTELVHSSVLMALLPQLWVWLRPC